MTYPIELNDGNDNEQGLKAYGYSDEADASAGALRLTEVTFVAEPALLREVGAFLLRSAEQLEQAGAAFGHQHLQDAWEGWRPEYVDVIVAQEK